MRLAALLLACAPLMAQVQGHLRYASEGRTDVVLDLVDGGHEAFLAIPPARGEAGALRLFVLSHTGPERMVLPPEVKMDVLRSPAPPAWKVARKRGAARLRTAFGEFWRYTPGLLLPVRFRLDGIEWALREADLPPKMLVSNGEGN